MKKMLILTLLCYSCSTNVDIATTNPTDNVDNTNNSAISNFEQKEINGLKFGKVSEQNFGLINNSASPRNQQSHNGQNMALPQDSSSDNQSNNFSVPNSQVGDASSISRPSNESAKLGYEGYSRYFHSQNPFEEYAVTDYEEAKTKGFTGTFLESYNAMVKPILKDWSADAKATSVYGNANSDGKGANNIANSYSPYQWQYTYTSNSKKEVYSILVSSKETLILRQKWNLKNLNDQNIKVDSTSAIKIFTDKIKDKNYNAEYDNNNLGPNSQPLYELPPNNYWTFYLSQEKYSLIWNINTNYYYPTTIDSESTKYVNTWYSGGYAKINATTGEIIYMTRPVKYTENTKIDYKCDNNSCVTKGELERTS